MSTENKQITELTKEQEAQLEPTYRKWLSIGLKTGKTTKADRKAAEEAIAELYKNEGLTVPPFVWKKSPLAGAKECIKRGDSKDGLVYAAGYGQHDANWLGFYWFMREVLGLKEETKDLVPLMKLAEHAGWWWPYDEVCIITERPIQLHVNEQGQLHNPKGPAIEYADGFALYYLNGIEVPKAIACKPVSRFKKNDILKQENADIRREVIRKIGAERMEKLLGSVVIDKFTCKVGGPYELVYVDYDGRGQRPYLKMWNRSLKGVVHLEGVPPGTKTVQEALAFRNGLVTYVPPEQLT